MAKSENRIKVEKEIDNEIYSNESLRKVLSSFDDSKDKDKAYLAIKQTMTQHKMKYSLRRVIKLGTLTLGLFVGSFLPPTSSPLRTVLNVSTILSTLATGGTGIRYSNLKDERDENTYKISRLELPSK
ncbi:MAG: hypothetical protein FWE47_02815 [Oscillospiraceae bacterium]|nr:hypothetical protein [Oscillospiraceae bacterium]